MEQKRIKLREGEWETEFLDYVDGDWYLTLEQQGWNGGRPGTPDKTESIDFREVKRLAIQNGCLEELKDCVDEIVNQKEEV